MMPMMGMVSALAHAVSSLVGYRWTRDSVLQQPQIILLKEGTDTSQGTPQSSQQYKCMYGSG